MQSNAVELFPKTRLIENTIRAAALEWLQDNPLPSGQPLWTEDQLDRPDFRDLTEKLGVLGLMGKGFRRPEIAAMLGENDACLKKRMQRFIPHLAARRKFLANLAALNCPSLD